LFAYGRLGGGRNNQPQGSFKMTTTAIAMADTEAPAVSREIPKIDPGQVRLDVSGHHHQRYAVTLPAGMIADDLKEPGAWIKVQATARCALRVYDVLFLVAHDGSWVADAIVAHASLAGATLTGIRIV